MLSPTSALSGFLRRPRFSLRTFSIRNSGPSDQGPWSLRTLYSRNSVLLYRSPRSFLVLSRKSALSGFPRRPRFFLRFFSWSDSVIETGVRGLFGLPALGLDPSGSEVCDLFGTLSDVGAFGLPSTSTLFPSVLFEVGLCHLNRSMWFLGPLLSDLVLQGPRSAVSWSVLLIWDDVLT